MLSSAVPVFIVRSLWLEHGIKTPVKFDIKGLYSKSRSDKQTNEQTNKQIFDL